MKKLLIIPVLAILAVSITAFTATADDAPAKPDRVVICHNNGLISDGTAEAWDSTPENPRLFPEGTELCLIIEVSEKAVPAHCRHGDRVIGVGWLEGREFARGGYGQFNDANPNLAHGAGCEVY